MIKKHYIQTTLLLSITILSSNGVQADGSIPGNVSKQVDRKNSSINSDIPLDEDCLINNKGFVIDKNGELDRNGMVTNRDCAKLLMPMKDIGVPVDDKSPEYQARIQKEREQAEAFLSSEEGQRIIKELEEISANPLSTENETNNGSYQKGFSPEDYLPGGIAYQEEAVSQDLDRPGVVSLSGGERGLVQSGAEALSPLLRQEFLWVDNEIDKSTGLVSRISFKNRPDNPYAKGNGSRLQRAEAFLRKYNKLFFSSNKTARESSVLQFNTLTRHNGEETIFRFIQVTNGIKVGSATIAMRVKDEGIMSVNAKTLEVPKDLSLTPSFSLESAKTKVEVLRKEMEHVQKIPFGKYIKSNLAIFKPRSDMLNGKRSGVRLAWIIITESRGVWVDAHSGEIIYHASTIRHIMNRNTSDCGGLLHTDPSCTLARIEGSANTGVTDVDDGHKYAGDSYQYFHNTHQRDSYNDAGAQINTFVRSCVSFFNCSSAEWLSAFQRIIVSTGWVADDVIAHEYTHAVIEYALGFSLEPPLETATLFESYSDIFGESVDLTNASGNDSNGVKWQIGEDVVSGAIRNMANPNLFLDPAKVSDSNYYTGTDRSIYIHTNNGVANHAFVLTVDGGNFNGYSIQGIGQGKAEKIYYEALTGDDFDNDSGFNEHFVAVNNACSSLIGANGITNDNCRNVCRALFAVELNTSGATCEPKAHQHDFNDNHKADILWRHATTGQNVMWQMNGSTMVANLPIDYLPDLNWKVKGTADFNNDGHADILWRNVLTGDVQIYLMDGNTLLSNNTILIGLSTSWKIQGVGDFNNDNHSDILWRHTTYGVNAISFIGSSGNNVSQTSMPMIVAVTDQNWNIQGVGDFNNDNRADIVWRHSITGENKLFLMNGSSVLSQTVINTVADLGWKIKGTGDFNHDGKADILWRNYNNGRVWMYKMDGASIIGSNHVAFTGLNWDIKNGSADYNGDHKSDVLWRSTTGENFLYQMNGFTATGSYIQFVPDTNWEIQ